MPLPGTGVDGSAAGRHAGSRGRGAPMSPPVAGRMIEVFRDFRPPEKSDRKLTARSPAAGSVGGRP